MKDTLLKQRTIDLSLVALVSLLGACATTASPRAENVLLSAGFKAKVATTAKQRQELQMLPEGKVSAVKQKGKTFYIYPDAPHNQIYVGNKAQYRAYRKRVLRMGTSWGVNRRNSLSHRILVQEPIQGLQLLNLPRKSGLKRPYL